MQRFAFGVIDSKRDIAAVIGEIQAVQPRDGDVLGLALDLTTSELVGPIQKRKIQLPNGKKVEIGVPVVTSQRVQTEVTLAKGSIAVLALEARQGKRWVITIDASRLAAPLK